MAVSWLLGRRQTDLEQRGKVARGVAAILCAGLTLAGYLWPPYPIHRLRVFESALATRIHVHDGSPDLALRELDTYLELAAAQRTDPAETPMVRSYRGAVLREMLTGPQRRTP
jgi:hypothetical protein